MRTVLANSDLVFARDSRSMAHLRSLAGRADNLRESPDFTVLVEGRVPPHFDCSRPQGAIAPNHWMLSRAPAAEAGHYVQFLAQAAECMRDCGVAPFLLLHAPFQDESLIEPVQRLCSVPLPVVRDPDPLYLKGILGRCVLNVVSRYHAAVSSLSQGVPALGTAWSHKYEELFRSYGCADCLLSAQTARGELQARIRRLAEPASRADLSSRLRRVAAEHRRQAAAMWLEVDRLLGLVPTSGQPGAMT